MTDNHHTPHAFGAPLTSPEVNGPLGELDAQVTRLTALQFNVLDYGAVGDGSTDDKASIQAAISAANAVDGGLVIFPALPFYVATPLTLYRGVHLQGSGVGGQQFVSDDGGTVLLGGSDSGIIVTDGTDLVGGDPGISGRKENYSLKGIKFKNFDASSAGTNELVDFRFAYNIVVEDCIFDGTDRGGTAGLVFSDSGHVSVRNCRFENFPQHGTEAQTRAAIEISPTVSGFTGGYPVQMFEITNCGFFYCGRSIDVGIRGGTANDGMHNIRIDSCFFKKSAANPFGTDVSTGIDLHTGVDILTISNCKFEDVRYPIDVVLSRDVRITNIFVHHAETAVDVATSTDVVVDGISLWSSTGNPLTTGVHFASNNVGHCSLLGWTTAGDTASSIIVIDNDAGLWGAPAGLVPDYGLAHVAYIATTANRTTYVPTTVRRTVAVTGIVVPLVTAGGTNMSVGIYDASGVRLATSGSAAVPATGRNLITFSGGATVYLKPGTYYLAFSCDSASPTFSAGNAAATTTAGFTQFEAAAHPVPSPATFGGAANNMYNIVGRVQGGWL